MLRIMADRRQETQTGLMALLKLIQIVTTGNFPRLIYHRNVFGLSER